MPHGNDFYRRNRKIIDIHIKNMELSNMELSKKMEQIPSKEYRLKRILGPFRNILPKIST